MDYEKHCGNCLHLCNDMTDPPCNGCKRCSEWESAYAQSNYNWFIGLSVEELAGRCIASHWDYNYDSGMIYFSILTEKNYTTFDGAYQANIEFLKSKREGK